MQESCSNEADPISCLCPRPQELLEEKLQTGPGKPPAPKILDAWMHNLCNFPKFSFGVHVQPGQTWPKFPIVITKLFVFFFFFLIRSRAYCNLQNDLNDRNWKSFTCEMSSKSIISKIAKWKSVIYKTRIHEVNSTGQKDKSVSSSLE